MTAGDQIRHWTDSGRGSFALSELQDLPAWTRLAIFGPYTPASRIQQTLGFEWKQAGTFGLELREDIYLAVFVSSDRVVRAEEWSRHFEWSPESLSLNPSTVLMVDRFGSRPTLKIAEPGGPTNRSQPIRSATNQTSSAAGSRR